MTDLLKFSLFEGLDGLPEALADIRSLMKERIFGVRELIIDERLNDSHLYFLLNGQVVVQKTAENGQVVTLAKADARTSPFFGEGAILGKQRKIASVSAYTECRCLVLSAKDFDSFGERHPQPTARIYRNIAGRLYDHLAKTSRDVFIAGLKA